MAGAVDFDAEYRIYDGKTPLSGTELTRRFLSLHLRLNLLEEKGASWDALQTEGLSEAIRRINAVITPLILETQGKIDDLDQQIADALALVEAKIAEAEARLDTIIAGGLPAADVAESATRVFVTPAQRTEIGALRTDLAAALVSIGQKLSTSAKATTAQAQAGTDDATYMTPKKTVEAISAVAGFFRKTVFTAGGVFVKDTKTKWLIVEAIGGGGSGGCSLQGTSGGGCGGSYVMALLPASAVAASETVTVGAGGDLVDPASAGPQVGRPGGNSTFGTLVKGVGGSGGRNAIGAAMPAHPTTGIGRYYDFGNNTSPFAISGDSFGFGGWYFREGGHTINGGGGGAGSYPNGIALDGGVSVNHGQGGSATQTYGNPGTAPGGGGAGGYNGASGAGARGEVRVWEFG